MDLTILGLNPSIKESKSLLMHGYFQYEMGLTLALIALSMLSMSSESLAFGVLVDISGTHPKHVTSNANLPTSQLLMPPPPKKFFKKPNKKPRACPASGGKAKEAIQTSNQNSFSKPLSPISAKSSYFVAPAQRATMLL